jgi:hypothetical protein
MYLCTVGADGKATGCVNAASCGVYVERDTSGQPNDDAVRGMLQHAVRGMWREGTYEVESATARVGIQLQTELSIQRNVQFSGRFSSECSVQN